SPRHRFQASSLIARIYRERDQLAEAIEWFERASHAPAATADAAYLLMYELADALEEGGEVSRALAIFMELQVGAGQFRDVKERIDRLVKVQTEGRRCFAGWCSSRSSSKSACFYWYSRGRRSGSATISSSRGLPSGHFSPATSFEAA